MLLSVRVALYDILELVLNFDKGARVPHVVHDMGVVFDIHGGIGLAHNIDKGAGVPDGIGMAYQVEVV